MRLHNLAAKGSQKGATLIELLIALAILVLMAVAISTSYDGSRARAQAMISMSSDLGSAFIRAKTDTGCYLNKPAALYDRDLGISSSNNFCGRDFTKTWNGPYVSRFPTDNDGNVVHDKVGADVVMTVARKQEGSLGWRYFVEVKNVPNDVLKQALIECNGTDNYDTQQINFNRYKCMAEIGANGSETGTFKMLFDETR